eukprot:CAMPEP_0116872298 /NCGR_PEP_ID=MMETSP0463-20121206/3009_1 /TAXON_ID=181622 /ORGANISM="Strombidinopsis sp, Strain SopsisLIS2011" /LENGTH=85 /DNA_ID=CAMNT_0004512301 /DNA_START=143 /DNA_END=400 /DNA_ORIENTATION=-
MYSDAHGIASSPDIESDMPFLIENGKSFSVDGIETFADDTLGWVSLRFTYMLDGESPVPGTTHGMDLFQEEVNANYTSNYTYNYW